MTTPHERTKAVVDTREFLLVLAFADEVTIRGLVQTMAMCLLKHYPLDVDLDVSAAALPGIWAVPANRQATSAAAREFQICVPGQRDAHDIRDAGADDDQTACGS